MICQEFAKSGRRAILPYKVVNPDKVVNKSEYFPHSSPFFSNGNPMGPMYYCNCKGYRRKNLWFDIRRRNGLTHPQDYHREEYV